MTEQELNELFLNGRSLYLEGDYISAFNKLQTFLQELGDAKHLYKLNALNLMGLMYRDKQIPEPEPGDAITYFERAFECTLGSYQFLYTNTAEWYEGAGDKSSSIKEGYKAFDYNRAIKLRNEFLKIQGETKVDDAKPACLKRLKRVQILATAKFDDMLNALLNEINTMKQNNSNTETRIKPVTQLYEDLKHASLSFLTSSSELADATDIFQHQCQEAIRTLGDYDDRLNLHDIITPSATNLGLTLHKPSPPAPADRKLIIANSGFEGVLRQVRAETTSLKKRPDATQAETDAAENLVGVFENARIIFARKPRLH
jgi:hypothetical protein